MSALSLQDSTISYKCIDGCLTVFLLSKKPGIADKEILHKLKVKHKSLKLIGKAMQIFIADNFTMSGRPKQQLMTIKFQLDKNWQDNFDPWKQ